MEKERTNEEILNGWKKTMEIYKPGELLPAEKAAFDRMIKIERANSECKFCLPPCKEFPNCKCGKHNKIIYEKHGL